MQQANSQKWTIYALRTAIIFCILLLPTAGALAQELSVQAAVDRNEVYVGEAFNLQIQVEGDNAPAKPDLSGLADFSVQELGGQSSSRRFYSMVNGKVRQNSSQGYIFNYRLSARRAGQLVIPAITAVTAGKKISTQPINITAKVPEENNDFKLRVTLSKTSTYVGEPVTLTITWYVGKECQDIDFNLPILNDKRFTVVAPLNPATPSPRNSIRIPIGNREVVASKTSQELDGVTYTAVSFSQVIIPRQAGNLKLPQATVACKILSGYHRDYNDPLASYFGRSRRGVYKSVITPSNRPQLIVKNLPTKNKPANFSGLIGAYSIATSASPTNVNIGDPITLTIMITGPDYLENATIPDLNADENLRRNFKIPTEMAAGEIKGVSKIFTQTIRAKNTQIKAIPAITLPFFDTASATYKTARSEPIPLQVKQTTTITAMDAEGHDTAPLGKELKTISQGIAHNYDDTSVLESRINTTVANMPIWWWLIIILPPAFFGLLLLSNIIKNNILNDPAASRSRQALAVLKKDLHKINPTDTADAPDRINRAMKEYLGAKLRITPASLTFADVHNKLAACGIETATINGLQDILETCEAHAYAGSAKGPGDIKKMIKQAQDVGREIERCWR